MVHEGWFIYLLNNTQIVLFNQYPINYDNCCCCCYVVINRLSSVFIELLSWLQFYNNLSKGLKDIVWKAEEVDTTSVK